MKPLLFSASAVFWLGLNAALAERFLKGNHPLWAQFIANCLLPVLCACSIFVLKKAGFEVPLVLPWWQFLLLMVGCNVVMFLGNGSFYAAYASGGTPLQVTTVLCALPIVTVGINVFLGGPWPTAYQWLGAALVVAGILVSFKK